MLANKNLLRQAQQNIYSFGTGDASEKVSQLNVRYGLGKIIYSLDKLGIDPQRTICVFSPDGGITRNKQRWKAGFSYGCYIRWPSLSECGKLIAFPEIKPNACGMLVAEIKNAPDVNQLCDRLHQIEKEGVTIEKSCVKLNVGVSNHFIEVCQATESNTDFVKKGSYYAVIHTSPSEFKTALYDFDGWHNEGGKWMETPYGKLLTLVDEPAKKYLDKYLQVEEFSTLKRLKIAKKLFGDINVISNCIHQGISSDNEARLGVYKVTGNDDLYPVAFRWDLQIYLVKSFKNLSDSTLIQNSVYDRAKKEGVLDVLKNSNMLPHGGGYKIPFPSTGWQAFKNGNKNLFSNSSNGNKFVFSSPSELPYSYRGLKIAEKIDTLKLGKVVAKLKQLYTLKY